MVMKLLSWAGKIIVTVMLVSVLSIWTTGFIITSYVESILKQYEIPIEIPPLAMSGVWGTLWGSDVKKSTDVVELSDQPSITKDPEGEEVPVVDENTAEPEEEAQEVMAPIELEDQEIAMTEEELEAAKSTLTEADKSRMLELLMSKLPPESWQIFSTYVEDGLTDQELLDVQQMMAQHLNEQEYEELMIILKKY